MNVLRQFCSEARWSCEEWAYKGEWQAAIYTIDGELAETPL